MNKTIYLIVFLLTCSVSSVSAWNVPEAVTNTPDQFTADFDPYISYQNSSHINMIQNAIRLFRLEGKTNWANLLEQNLQALADGATYADRHKGRVVARLYFEVLWGLWSYDLYTYDIGPLGGFDHYYDPNTGQGLMLEVPVLSNFCLDVLGQYLLDLGGLAGLKFEVNPRDIFHNYPSAVDLCQSHYDSALRNYRGEELLWPNFSPIYNTFFQAGWSAHFLQDVGVVQHLYNSFMGNHQTFEDDAWALGDPLEFPQDHSMQWTLGRDLSMSAADLARGVAVEVNQPDGFGLADSDDPNERAKVLPQSLIAAEQYTTAILAKLMTDLAIPEEVPPLEGRVVESKTGKPIPGAFVFYRERLGHSPIEPDSQPIYFLRTDAWDCVLADDNGHYTLPLSPGVQYLIRPTMPGYKFLGKYSTGGDISFTLNGPPFNWTQPSTTYESNAYRAFVMDPVNSAGMVVGLLDTMLLQNLTTGSLMRADLDAMNKKPIFAPARSQAPLPPVLEDAIHRALIEVTADNTILASKTDELLPSFYGLKLPEETYIEIQVSRLQDLKTARMLQSSSEIVDSIYTAKAEIAQMKAERLVSQPEMAADAADLSVVTQSNRTGLYATAVSKQTWDEVKMALPTQQMADDAGVTRNVYQLSYGQGGESLLMGETPFKYGLVRIPSLEGAQIEVSLATDQGCTGPDFIVPYSSNEPGSGPGSVSESASKRSLVLTTDSNGVAAFKLKAGSQAGKIRLKFKVIENPQAIDIKPADSLDIAVQPPIFGPDQDPAIQPTLEPVQPRAKSLMLDPSSFIPLDVWPRNLSGVQAAIRAEEYPTLVSKDLNVSVIEPVLIDIDNIQLAADQDLEWNVNLPGSDISPPSPITLSRDDPLLCKQACADNPDCKAWTYVKPGSAQGPYPQCWIKSDVPERISSECCVSGIG